MTERLYDSDSHLSRFTATVMSCVPTGDRYRVVLDRTAFFPGGGGQAADRGTIASYEVLKLEDEDGTIYHYLANPLQRGMQIVGEIDYAFRFDNMQQHSGEHILSGVAHEKWGYDNVGFHLNETLTTIDFNGPVSDEEARELELEANRIIWENLPVRIYYPDREELARTSYRSKKDLTGAVRLVALGRDLCACCAPHVQKTGEVGLIKIIARENYKGGVRLTVLCGERALKRMNEHQELLGGLAAARSTSIEKLPNVLEKETNELTAAKARVAALSDIVLQFRLVSYSAHYPHVFLVENVLDDTAARRLAEAFASSHSGRVLLLLPQGDDRFRYIACCENSDMREFSRAFNTAFNGRGGGDAKMVQGTVSGDPAAMKSFLLNYK